MTGNIEAELSGYHYSLRISLLNSDSLFLSRSSAAVALTVKGLGGLGGVNLLGSTMIPLVQAAIKIMTCSGKTLLQVLIKYFWPSGKVVYKCSATLTHTHAKVNKLDS